VGERGARNGVRNLSIDRLEKLPCKEFHVRKVSGDPDKKGGLFPPASRAAVYI